MRRDTADWVTKRDSAALEKLPVAIEVTNVCRYADFMNDPDASQSVRKTHGAMIIFRFSYI
jgi:hypothetical protein